jgi:hypothetical protein
MVETRLCFEYVWKDLDFGNLIVREIVRRVKDMNYRTTTRRPSNEPSLSEPQPVLIAFDMPILTLRESPQTPTNPPLDQLLHLLRLSYTLLLFFSSTPLEPRGRSPASPHLPILDFRRPLLEHQSLLANLRKMKSQIGKHAG